MKPSGIEPLFSPWKGDVLPLDEDSKNFFTEGVQGVEPRTFGLTVRCSTAELYTQNACVTKLPRGGIAPPTYGFSVHHSAAELPKQVKVGIRTMKDLHLRLSRCKRDTLLLS